MDRRPFFGLDTPSEKSWIRPLQISSTYLEMDEA